jgi:hypothetical protein
MWTEHVDVTNLDCRVWPRGSAVAASLWGLDAPSQDILSPRGRGSDTPSDLKYAAASGKAMVLSYVRQRYFLLSRGIEASELTFHELDSTLPAWHRSYVPRSFTTEQEVYRYIDNQNTLPISGYKRFDIGSLHMTSQCPVIDKDVFRPLSVHALKHRSDAFGVEEDDGDDDGDGKTRSNAKSNINTPDISFKAIQYKLFKAVQINVADGFPGDRRELMTTWFKNKANDGVDIIGKFIACMSIYIAVKSLLILMSVYWIDSFLFLLCLLQVCAS